MRDLGGLAGWLGVQGKGGVCRGGGSLGSGATRTWPPPWPPRGLPPPRWSWPLRSQSGFPRLPLPLRSPSPSWFSCPPSYHSQPFLSLLPSWPLAPAWVGPVSLITELISSGAPPFRLLLFPVTEKHKYSRLESKKI